MKKKPAKPKGKAGRPSSFDQRIIEQAYRLTLLGATDTEMAAIWDVDERTVSRWKKEFPEFLSALKRGKVDADSRVAESLFKKAVGFEFEEEVAIKYKTGGANGQEDVKIVKVRRFVHPDTLAGIYWLNNRKADRWRRQGPADGGEGDDDAPLPVKVEVTVKDARKAAD